MLNESEIKELLEKLTQAKNEVTILKGKLNQINKQKENWLKKKDEINKEISSKIGEIKGSKHKRNDLTSQVKNLKKTRNDLNKQINEKINEIKKLKDDYKSACEKHNVQGDPAKLKKDIESLEFKIETEPMKFDKEQKLRKEIKGLKKQYAELSAVTGVWDNVRKKSKDIDVLKKEANQIHKKVQDMAKMSQGHHEELIGESKEIDDMKKAEEEAYQKFFEYKKQFSDINDELKKKLDELKTIKDTLDHNKVELDDLKKDKDTKAFKEKEKKVQEKVKKKAKLTTEDLLVLQKTMMDEEKAEARKAGKK